MTWKKAVPWVFLATLGSLLSCAKKPVATQGPPPVAVQVAQVKRQDMPRLVQAVGTVVSPRVVQVRPRVGGLITAVHFQEGELVREGQLLLEIDREPYENALREAEARLARDRALLAKAEADLARAEALVAKDFITKEQLDQARANVQQLQAAVAGDRAAVDQARLQLSYCRITAPASGRAGELAVHPGNLVKANDDKPLVTIVQVAPVDVSFAVPEVYLPELRRLAKSAELVVQATARSDGALAASGKVTFLDNAVDPRTGTVLLKARFANEDGALWPGQFVDVALQLGKVPGALVVPVAAVIPAQQGDSVFVVKPDSTVELRQVKLAGKVGEEVIVAQGLAEGETVVTDGQIRLVPGARVEVRSL